LPFAFRTSQNFSHNGLLIVLVKSQNLLYFLLIPNLSRTKYSEIKNNPQKLFFISEYATMLKRITEAGHQKIKRKN
jgi:hypothetical protein